jgi:hypothetical protein
MRLFLVVTLAGCASSVSATEDDAGSLDIAVDQPSTEIADTITTDTTDAASKPDANDGSTCSLLPSPCQKGDSCDGVCGGRCVAWEYTLSSNRLALDHVCLRSSTRFPNSCSANLVGLSFCQTDEVCNIRLDPDGRISQSPGRVCVDVSMCVEFVRRFDRENPNATSRQGCWYSDMTLARTGVRAPARCLSAGRRTCGVGCAPCPEGSVCTWSSERYPTGLCMPIRPENNPVFQYATCAAPNRIWPCGAGQACLQPLRGNADRFADSARAGMCITTEECRAAAATFPDGYQCTYRPW